MKKLLSCFLAATLALSLCACGQEPEQLGAPESEPTEAADVAEPAENLSFDFEFKTEEREFRLSDSEAVTVRLEYDLYGDIEIAEAVSGGYVVGLLREGYLVLSPFGGEIPHVWLVNIADGTAEQVIPDELYGRTYQEYEDVLTFGHVNDGPDFSVLYWCLNPALNGDTLSGLKLAYYSNAFADDGGNIVTDSSQNGAIWVYDFDTKTAERIDPQGYEVSGGYAPCWPQHDTVSFVAGDNWFNYADGRLIDTEMNCDELFDIINEDEDFDAFLRHGVVETDASDSIEADGVTYYRVTDGRFDTEEHFNASMKAHYSASFIEQGFAAGDVKFSDGKTYCRAADEDYTDFPMYVSFENAEIAEGVYGDDQYFREFRVKAYTNPTSLKLREVAWVSLENGSEGWKVSSADRNVVANGSWVNLPEGLPITTDELDEILRRDELIGRIVVNGSMDATPDVTLTLENSDVCCKVADEVFTSAAKLHAFIEQTYTGDALDAVSAMASERYAESDGELYLVLEGMMSLENKPKNYAVDSFTDDSVTVSSYGGYSSENDDSVCVHTYVITKTADGWRIAKKN